MLNKCYKMYDKIIEDFVNDVLVKNNITDPYDIYSYYIWFYNNMFFSKKTNRNSFLISTNLDEGRITNDDNEILSDMMKAKNFDRHYRGMFMVNGDGVCRHINDMLVDIYNKAGFKAYKVKGNIENDLNGYQHMICYLDYNDEAIYLDAMEKKILTEIDRNDENTMVFLQNNIKNKIYSEVQTDFGHDIIFKKAKFTYEKQITDFVSKNFDELPNIDKCAEEFRKKHMDSYNYISNVLHVMCDPLKYKIKNIKIYWPTAKELLKEKQEKKKILK